VGGWRTAGRRPRVTRTAPRPGGASQQLPGPGRGMDTVPRCTTLGSSWGRVKIAAEGSAGQGSAKARPYRSRGAINPRRRVAATPPGRGPLLKCYAVHLGPADARLGPKAPGAWRGPPRRWLAARAASRWVRISGMTCSVLPTPDSQPHSQLARRRPRSARPAGATVTLCPATCSLTEMVTGTSNRSMMAELTRLGSHHQIGRLGLDRRSVGVALLTPRQVLVPIAALAECALLRHWSKVDASRKAGSPPLSTASRRESYTLLRNSLLPGPVVPGLDAAT
jgi:hypothetical protein